MSLDYFAQYFPYHALQIEHYDLQFLLNATHASSVFALRLEK